MTCKFEASAMLWFDVEDFILLRKFHRRLALNSRAKWKMFVLQSSSETKFLKADIHRKLIVQV